MGMGNGEVLVEKMDGAASGHMPAGCKQAVRHGMVLAVDARSDEYGLFAAPSSLGCCNQF